MEFEYFRQFLASAKSIALNIGPGLVICITLLIINQIFLSMLAKKTHTVHSCFKRKTVLESIQNNYIKYFVSDLVNNWKTMRNTKINSQKKIDIEDI